MKNKDFMTLLGAFSLLLLVLLPIWGVILAGLLVPAFFIFGLPILLVTGIVSNLRGR